MSIKLAAIPALAVIILSCLYSCTPERKGPAPTLTEAKEAEYQGIYDSPVRLAGGGYEGKPFTGGGAARPTLRLIGDLCVQGDLDGDGIGESAVLLMEDSGGSGSFTYIAVLERRGKTVRNIGTAPLGDRVQIRSLVIDSGTIRAEVVQHGPGEPMCCPTWKALRNWVLDGGSLVEGTPVMTGTVSIADIEGIEWALTGTGPDEHYGGDPPVTINFGNGRVSGSGGCNRYFAEVSETAPQVIELGTLGSTRMRCGDEIMEVEEIFLEALGGAAGYGFLAGRLMLTCRVEDRIVTLLFEPVAPR